MTRRRLIAAVAALCYALILTGCASNNFRDLKGIPSRDPDHAEVYNNVDGNPNITLVCIHGLGFATTTRNYGDALTRVDGWDDYCRGFAREP